jgi:hypothetical protein
MLVHAEGRIPADAPDIGFLPAVQRKRLSLQSKIALYLANDAVSRSAYQRETLASVFASRYGECRRAYAILDGIARGEAPTPGGFSASVHNTSSGLWSIAAECSAPSSTVAAGDATLHAGLLEAGGVSFETGRPVLFVYADVPLPERYGDQDRAGAATGFAAIVEPEAALEGTLSFDLSYAPGDRASPASRAVAQVAGLVELLTGTVTEFCACDGRIAWNLVSASSELSGRRELHGVKHG